MLLNYCKYIDCFYLIFSSPPCIHLTITVSMYLFIYVSVCVSVCVCVFLYVDGTLWNLIFDEL